MTHIRYKANGERNSQRQGLQSSYMLLSITLLFYIFVLILPGCANGAVFNVPAQDVYGPNGLVAAINAANSNGQSNNIILFDGTPYVLTSVDNDTDGPNCLPSIIGIMTISGASAMVGKGDVVPECRIFHVSSSGVLTLINIEFGGGDAGENDGGGLFNRGRSTTLSDSIVVNNGAARGGGIFNSDNADTGSGPGLLVLATTTIRDNAANSGGGGIFNQGVLSITDTSG